MSLKPTTGANIFEDLLGKAKSELSQAVNKTNIQQPLTDAAAKAVSAALQTPEVRAAVRPLLFEASLFVAGAVIFGIFIGKRV